MSNREKAQKLAQEAHSPCGETGSMERLAQQVAELEEKMAEISAVCESLIENVGSLEEENLELRRAMEAQGSSLTS